MGGYHYQLAVEIEPLAKMNADKVGALDGLDVHGIFFRAHGSAYTVLAPASITKLPCNDIVQNGSTRAPLSSTRL
jgi:hypothetical protein